MTNHNGDVGKMSPECWLFQHEDTGVTMYIEDWQVENGFEEANPRLQKIKPIYNQDALVEQVELMKEALLVLSVRSSVINSSVCTDIISKALDGVE